MKTEFETVDMSFFEEQVKGALFAGSPMAPSTMSYSLEDSASELDMVLNVDEEMSQYSAVSAPFPVPAMPTKEDVLGDALDALLDEFMPTSPASVSDIDSVAQMSAPSEASLVPHEEPQPSRKRGSLLKPIAKPKQFKRWKNATPSNYCHFCGSVPRGDKVVCQNLEQGTCRKVFCGACIEKIYGEAKEQMLAQPWVCTHCTGACPLKASCRYYSKTNSKRVSKKRCSK